MRKLIFALFMAVICSGNAWAECNKNEAKDVINTITSSGVATREESGITVWYIWKDNWYGLPKEQRYSFINGLAGVEDCLKKGVTTRIRVAGKDVARGNRRGVELLD